MCILPKKGKERNKCVVCCWLTLNIPFYPWETQFSVLIIVWWPPELCNIYWISKHCTLVATSRQKIRIIMSNQDSNKKHEKYSGPLRVLATFYFQPSWLFPTSDENRRKTLKRDLLIFSDNDDEASVSSNKNWICLKKFSCFRCKIKFPKNTYFFVSPFSKITSSSSVIICC